jgi:hypothetical protein
MIWNFATFKYILTNANGVDKLFTWHVDVVGYLQDYH